MGRDYKHIKAQKEGKSRDGFCQLCGSTQNLEGHHIFDVQFGGAANKDNIVSLCDKCHDKVHANKVDIDIF